MNVLTLVAILAAAVPEDPTPNILISSSDQQCGTAADHTSDPWTGQRSLYVWVCGGFANFEMTEFGIQTDFTVVDLIPLNGAVNVGTITSPTLAYPGCPAFQLLAELIVEDSHGSGGSVCLGDSETNQLNCTQFCFGGGLARNRWVGFSSAGGPACEGLADSPGCMATPVEPESWGRIKGQYR